MKVVLLAAGRSRRLKPIEDKNFLPFFGKPLIEHQIRALAAVGLKDILLVGARHNLAQLKAVAKSLPYSIQVIEQKNLNEIMGGAVLAVEKFIKNDSVLVVSAQDVVDSSAYKAILEAISQSSKSTSARAGAPMAKTAPIDSFLIGKKVDSYFPGGYLKVAKNGFITGIIEKPGEGKEPSNMVNLVVHYHRDGGKLIAALKGVKSARADLYEVALDRMIKAGAKMQVIPYHGYWQAIKYPWHVLDVMNHFLEIWLQLYPEGCIKKIDVAKTATLRGGKGADIYLEDGVRIMDNAVIIGPAYIGKNTIIATNALVRGSHIGANCVIGFGTEVARSYLGDDVWTHTNYIGDSVIGNDVSFGSGSVTGNLRLDEGSISVTIQDDKVSSGRNKLGLITGDHVRVGINTSLMPGIKIGNNSVVGAGIVVSQDVPDNSYLYGKMELVMKENKVVLDRKKREEMKKKLRITN